MGAKEFRAAVEAGDHGAMVACLTDDVLLHSPVTFEPFVGRAAVSQLFAALLRVFDEFRYTDELIGDAAHGLVFRARVGDRDVEGIDILRFSDDGRISDFTVMVRPRSAVEALGTAVMAELAKATAG